MDDKGIQVSIGSKRKKTASAGSQTAFQTPKEERATQCGMSFTGSYGRNREHNKWRYDDLVARMQDKEMLVHWLMNEELMVKERSCPMCAGEMSLTRCEDRSDGLKWECRKQVNGKKHRAEVSIWKGSWFDSSKMTLEEILKLTYWWCQDLDQTQVKHELRLAESTGVDWDSFCREVCEITLLENGEKLGGNGKVVQIDESKFGKRKYHRGHHVEGQWVFGGIEQDSRKCFLVAVEKRDEQTLLPIIQKWIEPGTVIVSDCWKAYSKLEAHGYEQRTVNHSREFVNKDGDHTNKIEGHWRHAKCKLPKFGVRKHLFSTYLAEFIWRYMHCDEDLFRLFLNDVKKVYASCTTER